jgi:hypothetical protein
MLFSLWHAQILRKFLIAFRFRGIRDSLREPTGKKLATFIAQDEGRRVF